VKSGWAQFKVFAREKGGSPVPTVKGEGGPVPGNNTGAVGAGSGGWCTTVKWRD
jgi:hypothetical protein